MLKQMFGKNRNRMVEEAEDLNPLTGRTIEFFTAYTLHGDRWLPEPGWKPKSHAEALAWLEERR